MTTENKSLSAIITDNETKTQSVNAIWEDYLKWHPKYDEFAQGRTNFQIEKFTVFEDGTPANNYVNTLYQTRVMRGELLRELKEGIETQRLFDWRWGDHDPNEPIETVDQFNNTKLLWYDLEKMAHDHRIMELKMSIKDKLQQLDLFDKILTQLEENHGRGFTREDYDNEAPLYWEKRFERQALDSIIYARTGVDTGTIKSIRQGIADPIVKDSVNKMDDNSFVRSLLDADFNPQEAIAHGNKSIDELYSRMHRKDFLLPSEEAKVPKIEDKKKNDPYSLSDSALSQLGIKKG